MITFLQLYSDKSITSLKVSGLNLYPLHVNVMDISKIMHDFMSSHGHNIIFIFSPVFLCTERTVEG